MRFTYWSRNFDSKSNFFVFFFFPKLHLEACIQKRKVVLFYQVNIQCTSYKLVTFIWTSLRVNPAHVKSALLEITVKSLK